MNDSSQLAEAPENPAVSESTHLKKRVISGSVWTIASYGASQVLRLGGNLVFAHLLFPEAFGLMTLMTTVIVGLGLFSDLGLNTSVVRIGEIFRPAIEAPAAAVIIAHNHPSGSCEPSPEDVRVTQECVKAGKLLGIEVLDHIIIGDGRYASLKERALGF